MGKFALKHRFRRRPLRLRQAPISQVDRPAELGKPSSRSQPPVPAPSGAWRGMETRREAEDRNEVRVEVLRTHLPLVARALIRCEGADERCSLPICAVCALEYRQDPIAQLHAL